MRGVSLNMLQTSARPDCLPGDVALPESARKKIARIRAIATDAHRLLMARRENVEDARAKLARSRQNLDEANNSGQLGEIADADRAAAREEVEAREAELAEVEEIYAGYLNHWEPLGRLRTALDRLIMDGGFFGLADPVETSSEDVEAVRERIASAKAEIARIESSPCSIEEAKAAARAEIEREAAGGAPAIGRFMQPGGPGLSVFNVGEWRFGGRFVVWALQDFLIAKTNDELERLYAGRVFPISSERKMILEKLRRDLHADELIEEALIEPDGRIARRGDASPRAVLGLAL